MTVSPGLSSGKAGSLFAKGRNMTPLKPNVLFESFVLMLLLLAKAVGAQSSALSPLIVPEDRTVGACVAESPSGGRSSIQFGKRYSLRIGTIPEGMRTIGIALDSAGAFGGLTENIVAANPSDSRTIAAWVTPDGKVQGFASVRRAPRGARPDTADLRRVPLDSAQRVAVTRVADWVRARCTRPDR